EPDDAERLFEAYIAAFGDSIEYCDYSREKIERAARKTLDGHFVGERGEPMPVSCVAVDLQKDSSEEKLVGAALIVRLENGPLLDLLLVEPPWQRCGLGTAMVSAAINELHQQSEKSLTSRYHIGNEKSLSWHQKFGFIEEPDLIRARLYYRRADQELWRRDRMSDLTPEERERLGDQLKYWFIEVERLERIEKEQGYEAVHPLLRW
ncbi:MAG: GNAT family N-acetyltransferase, partial [Acidobacteria bacterium]|nr:GNAT family N-acetyltransferase [Acidobacteriota bacterium]